MKTKRLFRWITATVTAVALCASFPVYAEGDLPGEDFGMAEMDSDVSNMADESEELPDKLKYADQADMSLEEYIALHPETAYEDGDGIPLEEYLAEGNTPFLVNAFPDENGIAVAAVTEGTWVEISSGVWKYRLSDGSYASGWVQDSTGFWFYLDPNNNRIMVTGWKKIGSYWYFFQPSGSSMGRMKHGWMSSTDDNGNTVYYYMGIPGDTDSGAMYTGGWLHDTDGKWYYLDKSTGIMYTNRLFSENGKLYYFGATGEMVTSQLRVVNGSRYYFNTDGTAVKSQWTTIGSSKYYFGSDGKALTGLQTISGRRYYFNSYGQMQTGWLSYGGSIYYPGDDGAFATGTVQMSEYVRSYFDSNGCWLRDEMVEKTEGMHGYPLNVRWKNLAVSDGIRYAYGTVNGSTLDATFSGITESTVNYYNNNSNNIIRLTSTTSPSQISLKYETTRDLSDSLTAVAETFVCNENGDWIMGRGPSSSSTNLLYTGMAVGAVIEFYSDKVNTDYATQHGFIDDWLNYLVRHELGHALGLRHTFEGIENETQTKALMHPYVDDENARSTFQSYDILELNKTYPQ